MITQQDIDALKRIRKHCINRRDICGNCPFNENDCMISFPDEWILDDIKPDATDEQLCQTVETPAIKNPHKTMTELMDDKITLHGGSVPVDSKAATPESVNEMLRRTT